MPMPTLAFQPRVQQCLLLLAAALAALAALAQPPAQPASERIVGIYTLAEYAGHGDRPTGRIAYDGAGRMWAMLAPPDRAPITSTSSADDYRAAMSGLVAYYGTYTLDEDTGRVIHHVEAASNTAWAGTDFVRWYRFEDGDLRLSLNPEFENTLLWQRMPVE